MVCRTSAQRCRFGRVRGGLMRAATLVLGLALSISPAAAQHAAMHRGPTTAHVLAAAREAAAAIADTTAARAAGYRPIEELGIPDRNPFQGQHWYNRVRSD